MLPALPEPGPALTATPDIIRAAIDATDERARLLRRLLRLALRLSLPLTTGANMPIPEEGACHRSAARLD